MATDATNIPPALDAWIDELVSNVRRVALDHPDRVYSRDDESVGCTYVPDHANPDGCIIGAAARLTDHDFDHLDDLRPDIGVTEAVEIIAAEEFGYQPDDDTNLRFDGDTSLRVAWWLSDVQEQQDQGMTWLYAVTHADDEYPLEG